jgi:hypothetical protein
MLLHENKDVFFELVQFTAETIGLPQVYVEKDYWVTKALKSLSESKYKEEVVFKGGTSLSKAYRLIDRFSEDIDLAVVKQGKSGNAIKKLIKSVETVTCNGFMVIEADERISKSSTYRKTVYRYPRDIDGESFGQASPDLLIEVNAFTHPQPVERKILQTLIADVLLNQELGRELIEQYELNSFEINVLSVRRTLIEKLLGVIKNSYNEDPIATLSARIRHLYDIAQILAHDEYREFVESVEFLPMCAACIKDEKSGFFTDSDCLEHPLADAPLFSEFENWKGQLNVTYSGAFSDLVYGDLPSMDNIAAALVYMHDHLKNRC